MVTAKIVCQSKVESGEGEDRTVTVTFAPDYADERNKEWARWTPGLSLTMGLKGAVADRFEQGKPYTLQFVEDTTTPTQHASPGCACGTNDAGEQFVDPICTPVDAA